MSQHPHTPEQHHASRVRDDEESQPERLQAVVDAAADALPEIFSLNFLQAALRDRDGFMSAMREAGMFAANTELCSSFEEARDQLVEGWIERDSQELVAMREVKGVALHPALKMWLDVGRAEGQWLWLYGDFGTGKTQQAMELIRSLHWTVGQSIPREELEEYWHPRHLRTTRACTVTYTTESELIETLRPNSSTPQPTSYWQDRSLLIIDEACATPTTQWSEDKLFSILDARMRHKKPTVFLSNWRPDQVDDPNAWDSPRLKSRLGRQGCALGQPWAVELRGDWRRGGSHV